MGAIQSFATRTGPAYALRSSEYLYDPLRGGQLVSIYDASLDGVTLLMGLAQPWDRVSTSGSNPPQYVVTIYSPDPTETPVWEVVSNFIEMDIVDWAGTVKGLSEANCQAIQNWEHDPSKPPTFTGDSNQIALANNVASLVYRKHNKHAYENTVLRYSVTISNAIQTKLAYSRSGYIFTTAQLINPNYSGLIIPAPTVVAINDASTAYYNMMGGSAAVIDPDSMMGWLKLQPTSRQTVIGKLNIVGEYWLGIYDVVTEYQPVPP